MSVVQELLGHDDLATTQTYAQVTYSHKQQFYEKYFHQ
jgi:site-specific recombinase XerD